MRSGTQGHHDDISYPSSIGFLLIHVGCFAAVWTGVPWSAVALAVVLYGLRIFAIGAGYHRYFSHRAFSTGRIFQFALAFLAQTSAQRGVLWWASKHRLHHRYSDTADDIHSPVQRGFLYSHVGWIFVPRNDATDYSVVRDLARFKELVWLDRQPYLPAALLAVVTWLIAGWPGLAVGFCWSTVAVWHATFCINSLAHVAGRKRYVTGDQSRNNWLLALLTMGEGWHNNHHAYQASVRQGFLWWEYDPTYYALRILSWLGVVWDLHLPPRAVIRGEHRLGRLVIDRIAGQLAASFPVNQIAHQVREALAHSPRWAEVQIRIASTRNQAETFWSELDLPEVPSLEEVRRYARERLAQTSSLEDIAVRARERLLELVYARLCGAGSLTQPMPIA
ncbi:MAG TPA: acyl-CoA desaturase [Acetobacteraceae bacterium]|jgi:stearoyl-CoA desaturase (delta-9 desaturase)|nr:acyl-CoA desaturase [Acetobacteraceae bacterium]